MKNILEQEEDKQETLEDAAEKYIETTTYMNLTPKDYIKFGANWQAEKMYTEEEVLRIIQECKFYLGFGDEFNEIKWFEQHKKK